MEKVTAFTHRLELALRLVDTMTGGSVSGIGTTVRADGTPQHFGMKDGLLIFQGIGLRQFRLEVSSPAYETAQVQVDLDEMGKGVPLLELPLIPGRSYAGGTELLTVEGVLDGIEELSAVRAGDNACLIREFDPRKRIVKLFNPHHLSMNRLLYALVDPDSGTFEPFHIVKMLDDQSAKIDRVLETEFRNYFPISPVVLGSCRADGRYRLCVRDDGTEARWLLRWRAHGETYFRAADLHRETRLEQEGGT